MQLNKHNPIAIVGVSSDKNKHGHKIYKELLDNGYWIFGVNPKLESLLDQKICPTLSSLPELPEIVVTVVPPQVTLQIVRECQELGIKNIWMQPGSESPEAIALAEKNNMNVTSNACVMKRVSSC